MMYFRILVAAGLLSTGAGLGSCQSKPAEQPAATTAPANAAATDSTAAPTAANASFICPMGCEGSASDKPGKCPVCNMDLEPNPATKPAAAL